MKLKGIIEQLIEFGTKPMLNSNDNELKITELLVGLYSEYLKLDKSELDNETRDDVPEFEYEKVRKFVEINFPEYGWYHSLINSHKITESENLVTGDAIDDLTDIIKDMMEVKWTIENESASNGMWLFNFLMQHHCEQHLVNFLKYAKDQKG
ncbi:DUF5063 domain-containing protein [Hyunsoonleella flava]|uniref:DUF5063 domain-containing protein n=1 Tax=Hyunsoonleella flava TaxID=2527939 RepID=UPI001F408E90|nr:DUF5063 domain-containing protein [Hyunsoonleella flava]